MNNRIGKYLVQKVTGEYYKAYIPPKLMPELKINLNHIYPNLEKATHVLAQLNSLTKSVPNPSLFIYMYVRKEALLSSQIEGTQSSFSDLILFEHQQKTDISLEDVEEVSNYVKALNHGLDRLKNGFPLSLRLLCEIHSILLSGVRGSKKQPGEFRRSQNWIGGTRPGNAIFVPPPVHDMIECLSDFEKFLHNRNISVLIKAAISHVQFETIHPFLDGNGRLGRLLITLLLCDGGMIDEPILYLSLFLKENRTVYYQLLQQVRTEGSWEVWLEFFLEGIFKSANQAITTINSINELFAEDFKKISSLGRARFSCIDTLEYLKRLPQISVPILSKDLNISAPTARVSLNHLVKLKIIEEVTNKKRDKIYVYRNYLNILEDGTTPLID
ncbi:Adenosine monophosphate-protein transferase SoFic [Candidatus Arcanobacter lacustris]|uniref:Adenosine monophosphate-protein transferase SoFic n=1 Tax=Candidatus Arcanibacter lacustris TaxID=1607817 RepID=A0A0F5MMW6_9RICK|nr:Adenosine monophosphate-protein transferase SoFic [Candidatus Arcanobacter lacustris]